MSNRDPEKNRAYMREYMARRYDKRRTKIIEYLGDKCHQCGNRIKLQVDHKDPKKKRFSISKNWNMPWDQLVLELDQCQLLCQSCHADKTTIELGKIPAKGTHGTISSYRYCRCKKCKSAMSKYMKEYYRKRRARGDSNSRSPT